MKTFEKILDLIFPPSSIDREMREINIDNIYQKCRKANILDINNTIVFFDYKDKLIRHMIHSLKFKGNTKIAKLFAEVIYNEILEEIADLKIFSNFEKPLLIPIPISPKRRRERGFNQTEIIAKEIIKLNKNNLFDLDIGNLIKIKNTNAQSSLKNRRDRFENQKGCFSIRYPEKIKDRNIILIDDVITTGATITEAKKTLKQSGSKKIITVAFAH